MKGTVFVRTVLSVHSRVRSRALTPASCTAKQLNTALDETLRRFPSIFEEVPAGSSVEGRPIRVVRCGTGRSRVLLWSQMHGNEPTATLAIADILRMLATAGRTAELMRLLRERLTMVFLPMLNPDGAQSNMRHNSLGIDLNRDARAFASPEARVLQELHDRVRPHFALNLHDQTLCSAGTAPVPAALALLAPPPDQRCSISGNRRRAMKVGAAIVQALGREMRGRIAAYDNVFEPRAFGDLFQSMGTSTLLVESGHWPEDPDRERIRALTVAAILAALKSIADRSYRKADLSLYTSLPPNGTRVFDVIVRGARLRHRSGWTGRVDVGLVAHRDSRPGKPLLEIKEVGDLSLFGALLTVEGRRKTLLATKIVPGTRTSLSAVLRGLQKIPPSRRHTGGRPVKALSGRARHR